MLDQLDIRGLVRVLLSSSLICIAAPGWADQEIGLLTIRKDNIHKITRTELLPIAKVAGGQFQSISGIEPHDNGVCALTAFDGWAQRGIAYDVLHRGTVIGTAKSLSQSRGGYSCSELCVIRTAANLYKRPAGVSVRRQGFDPSGSFDESITQYVAHRADDAARLFDTRATAPLGATTRNALQAYATARLATQGTKTTRRASIDSVEPLSITREGELVIFVSAVLNRPGGALSALSSVVRPHEDGRFDILFELVGLGDADRGAPSYEFVDAADFDGDGVAELLVIFHDYEFHEFQILKRIESKYEIVHKGPIYGC